MRGAFCKNAGKQGNEANLMEKYRGKEKGSKAEEKVDRGPAEKGVSNCREIIRKRWKIFTKQWAQKGLSTLLYICILKTQETI